MVDRAMQRPVKGVKQELAERTGGAVLACQKQDIAHRLHRAQVVGVQRNRQRAQEVVQGEPITALTAHGGDVQLQQFGALLHGPRAGADQVAAGG
ncbi:hypothetical protein D3C79_925780 [compost metagenome]